MERGVLVAHPRHASHNVHPRSVAAANQAKPVGFFINLSETADDPVPHVYQHPLCAPQLFETSANRRRRFS